MANPPEEVTHEREREAWSLRQEGWTQERIAQHLDISQQGVSKILTRVEERLAAEFVLQAELIKARQTAQLERIADEALTQWRRSCEDGVTEVTVKGKVIGKAGKGKAEAAGKDESRAQVTRTVQGQSGNPSLLVAAMKAMEGVRTIWGLDAPARRDVTSGGEVIKSYAGFDTSDV